MSGFAKVYASLLRSSIWEKPAEYKAVWITMLIMADANGFIEASPVGIAHEARESVETVEEVLSYLSEPDPYSRDDSNEGRRIGLTSGGYKLLNHLRFRKGNSKSPEAMRKKKSRSVPDIASASASASASNKQNNKTPIPDDWGPNPKHAEVAKAEGLDLMWQAEKFRDTSVAKAWEYAGARGWDAAFRNWLRSPYREADRKKGASGLSGGRSGAFNPIAWAAKQQSENASDGGSGGRG